MDDKVAFITGAGTGIGRATALAFAQAGASVVAVGLSDASIQETERLYFSEDAYKLATEPKELYIVPSAGHVDLYERLNYIPFDKLTFFFTKHLT